MEEYKVVDEVVEEVTDEVVPETLGVLVVDEVKSLDIGPGQGRKK